MGKVMTDMDAVTYHDFKPRLQGQIHEVFDDLASEHDVIVLEGAGSPAEINLRDRDIVNMGMAELIDAPVILVADIDRTRTPDERDSDTARIRQALTTAWQTAEASPLRPTVADETAHVGFYLGEVLYRVLPALHREFARAVAGAWGTTGAGAAAPACPA